LSQLADFASFRRRPSAAGEELTCDCREFYEGFEPATRL
jgi:hypothetical protein